MSDSVQPHRRQPTRLPCPWDSPGKNTGVGCHFLLQCMKVKSESEVAHFTESCIWLLATPWTAAYQAPLSMGFSRQEHWSGLPLTAAWGLHPVCHPFLYSPATENGLYLIFLILCPEFTFFKHFINLFGCTGSLLQHVGSLVVAHKLLVETWDLIPWPGIKSRAPCIESTES